MSAIIGFLSCWNARNIASLKFWCLSKITNKMTVRLTITAIHSHRRKSMPILHAASLDRSCIAVYLFRSDTNKGPSSLDSIWTSGRNLTKAWQWLKGLGLWQCLNLPPVLFGISHALIVCQTKVLNCLNECELLCGLVYKLQVLFFSFCRKKLKFQLLKHSDSFRLGNIDSEEGFEDKINSLWMWVSSGALWHDGRIDEDARLVTVLKSTVWDKCTATPSRRHYSSSLQMPYGRSTLTSFFRAVFDTNPVRRKNWK